ncbi:PEP/pyruvate-binding domain-containing protein [Streptomyces caeni]|uniref:PEP/pyruvate-binding domain-containing protein n=1 Tax=Streptomyces caeni TaxID=2307231 RepID=A0ABW4IN15_9ACTN
MTATDYVVPLDRVTRADVDLAGGKAANLGELIRAGFPVPPGFVVTAAACRPPDTGGHGRDTADGAGFRAAVRDAEVPEAVRQAVRAAYRELGGGAVAVRSSATTEDLPQAASAGQQDTFLHVVGERDLLDAVRRCRASLWTDRAIDYRAGHGIDRRRAGIAVVVQRMVPAEFAGVAFTCDPVTGDRHTVVIDASPGLGEAVVAGLVTPEHIVVDTRRRARVAAHSAGGGEVRVRPRAGGGTERVAGDRPATGLPAPAVRRLVRLARRVERHFGRPQDIEWAWAGGTVHLLQTRPVTALPEQPVTPGRVQRLTAPMLAEVVPVRPYPIDLTAWVGPLVRLLEKPARVTGFAAPPLDRMFVGEDAVVARVEFPVPRPTWHALTAPAHLVSAAARHDPRRWRSDPLLDAARHRARALRERDLHDCSWPELLAVLHEGPRIAAQVLALRLRYLPRTGLALAGLFALLCVLRRRGLLGALLTGVDTLTSEANRALEDLAAAVRADPGLLDAFARHSAGELPGVLSQSAPSFLADVEAFLDRYGHRDTVTPLLVSQPTWRERPDVVLSLLTALASRPPPREGPCPAARAERELLSRPLLRLGPPVLRTAVRALLGQARWFQQVRDDTRFLAMLPLPTMRQALRETARRLVGAKVLDGPEDIVHLRLDELERIGTWPPSPALRAELRAHAARRKAARARLAGTPLVPLAGTPAEAGAGIVLRGTPGSAGVAQGPVRIVHDEAGFGSLRSGEVLVAPYTSPAWTPLFRRAAAVVVDTGGMASHAAIAAREYGIPAVMATGRATTRLTDGQRVRVDGDHGLVLLA